MISKRIVLLAGVLFPLFSAPGAWTQDAFSGSKNRFLRDTGLPWEITADRLSQDQEGGLIVAEGDVVIRRGTRTLQTAKAIYNKQTGVAVASGGFRLEADGDLLVGEEGIFDLRDETGRIAQGFLFLRENHVYLRGGWIERESADTYRITDCKLTTCDGDRPVWSITGSEVEVTVEGYGTVKHAAFRVKDVPVLYFPYFIFPAKTRRQSGLLPPTAWYSSRNGFELELPFFWAISDGADATFYQHYLSKRGYMQGVELRYDLDRDSKGVILADVLSDDKTKDPADPDDLSLSPFPRTNETRYWLRGRADQVLPFALQVRADVDYVSDQDYLQEFNSSLWGYESRPDLAQVSGRPVDDDRSPGRRNAVRAGRETQAFSLHATGSYWQIPQDEGEGTVAQPLGGLDLRVFPAGVEGIPSFLSLVTEYDYVWRGEGPRGHRMDFRPDLNFPLWLGPYVEIEPSAMYEIAVRYVDRDEEGADIEDRRAYQTGLRMATNLERVFQGPLWGATAVKHRFRPTLSYRYRVPTPQDIPSPWFEPIDLEGKVNRVALTLENYLDARLQGEKGTPHYRQWAYFYLSQGYDIDKAREEQIHGKNKEPLDPLTGALTLQPVSMLDLYGTAAWDHYDRQMNSVDLSLAFSHPRGGNRSDSLALTYRYLREQSEVVQFEALVNLAYGFSVGGALSKELRVEQTVSSSVWIDYENQCWGIRAGSEKEDEETRFMFLLRLKGLGEVKARGSWPSDQ